MEFTEETIGDVYFANLHDESLKYMHLTKIDTVVKAFDSIEEAVADFEVVLAKEMNNLRALKSCRGIFPWIFRVGATLC